MDAGSADNERHESVRQRRVVLTPVMLGVKSLRNKLLRGDGGNRASPHRGERVISRKAIAQGRPGVLRCPVCSCALCFVPSHTRSRVQRAPGLPCALSIRGREVSCKARADDAARSRSRIWPSLSATNAERLCMRAQREPGIHRARQHAARWIPGSRFARPGMTVVMDRNDAVDWIALTSRTAPAAAAWPRRSGH